jgi:D-alanyl-D-alanine carboxypeptidase (penicillin-binding protein 5/6)
VQVAKQTPQEPIKDFQAFLLENAETGEVLLAEDCDKPWPAASLTKMMVGLLALESVEQGLLSMQTPAVISEKASHAKGRTINLKPGEVFPFAELLQAMLVTSANDAAVAVAERLSGSVETCVLAMNKRAQELGMQQTSFGTANGLPLSDGSAGDFSSAADMAILARELLKHPQVLSWTSLEQVPFRDGLVMLPNTNRLVGKVYGVDGLKTGYTSRARFNLVATAQRGEKRLIAVVLGGRTSRIRFATAENFLEWGFTNFVHTHAVGHLNGSDWIHSEAPVHRGQLQPVTVREPEGTLLEGY